MICESMFLDWIIQFGPITLFFVFFEVSHHNFFAATTALIAATTMAVLGELARARRIALFPLFSACFILFFGSATIFFHNPQFLIIKDTLYDFIFGGALLVSFFSGKNLMRAFFGTLFAISDQGWRTLALRWAIYLLLSGLLNELVRQNFSAKAWVYYKIANTLVLLIFGLYQLTLTRRERLPEFANHLGLRVRQY